jgi:cardiolipin synthase A/B
MNNFINNTFTQNKILLFQSGKPFFDAVIQLILNATETIHVQMYILNDDETGNAVVNALKIARKKNVKIYVLADGYASKDLSNEFIENLQKEGIHFRFFKPFFKNNNFYLGRRLHQKLIVIDSKYAVVGGMNIANRYNDMPNEKAWLDYGVFIEGVMAKELCILCWKTWNGFKANMKLTPCEQKSNVFVLKETETALTRIRRNDWVRVKDEITTTYDQIFKQAKREIIIICSYFLPGSNIRKRLRFACANGVKIKLILAGQSDVKIAKSAERWMYDWLLRRKIEIYEYQPTVLHAKMCVVDESFVTIGSYNINNISAYASIELNIDIADDSFAKQVTQHLNNIIATDCIPITKEVNHKTNNVLKQLYHWGSYKIFRIGFFLSTFYFKQKA